MPRPAGQMTRRRAQVLASVRECRARGEGISYAALARACGLYDYRHARRILRDLEGMGAL